MYVVGHWPLKVTTNMVTQRKKMVGGRSFITPQTEFPLLGIVSYTVVATLLASFWLGGEKGTC